MSRSKLIANFYFICWGEASEEELGKVKPSAKAKPKVVKAAAKTKATSSPLKNPEPYSKHDRSPVKKGEPSPNPGVTKRMKGKQSEPDQTKMIEELKKAGFEGICYLTPMLNYPIMCERFFVTMFLQRDFFQHTVVDL